MVPMTCSGLSCASASRNFAPGDLVILFFLIVCKSYADQGMTLGMDCSKCNYTHLSREEAGGYNIFRKIQDKKHLGRRNRLRRTCAWQGAFLRSAIEPGSWAGKSDTENRCILPLLAVWWFIKSPGGIPWRDIRWGWGERKRTHACRPTRWVDGLGLLKPFPDLDGILLLGNIHAPDRLYPTPL